MHTLYIGDARHLGKRIRQHIGGNIEASALRKHVAARKGYGVARTRRASGSYRQRLALPDPKRGEQAISAYLRAGRWRIAPCADYNEAQALQWFLIDRHRPLLNVDRRPPDPARTAYLEALWQPAAAGRPQPADVLTGTDAPGVYVLYHATLPEAFAPA